MIDDITKDVYDINLTIVIFKLNIVGPNLNEWWVDTGVICYACSNKKIFFILEPIEIEKKVFNWLSLKLRIKEKWY